MELDMKTLENRKRALDLTRKTLTYVFLGAWALIVLFPFFWMIITSLKSYGSYVTEDIPSFYPTDPTLGNYVSAITDVPLLSYCLNTLIFTVITTAIMLVVTVLAAFGFSRINFKGRDLAFTLFLALMMIPSNPLERLSGMRETASPPPRRLPSRSETVTST